MSQGLLGQSGAQPQKQPKYVPLFQDRMFTGLYTQRAILHDPSDIYTARYYGGRPDALLGGRNIELTNRLTLQRRPGMVPFRNIGSGSGAIYPSAPDRAFSFQLSNGTIQVIVDTTAVNLTVNSCNSASAGSTVYNGTFPYGINNAYVGLTFQVTGFLTHQENNGTFVCTASNAYSITLSNAVGVAETPSTVAEAITAGGIYVDNQNGTATLLYGKSVGAGQGYFISVAGVLYWGDGVDTKKYTPLNTNGTVWNWGIVGPSTQPSLSVVPSGSASTTWQASTVFSTMGLTLDTNSTPQIWQLIGTAGAGANATPQFATTGTGEPNWNTTLYGTTTDGTITWRNLGLIQDWMPNTYYSDGGTQGATGSYPAVIGVLSVSGLYVNERNSGSLGKTEQSNTEPKFTGAWPGANYPENNNQGSNGLNWFPIYNWAADSGKAMRWKQSHAYPAWYTGSPTGSAKQIGGTITACITGNLPSTAANPVYLQVPLTGGTSGSGYAPFQPNFTNQTVNDNQAQWLCLGPAARQTNANYTPWTAQGNAFGCILDSNNNFQVCTASTGPTSGTATSSITWGTTYGSPTTDGGVTWVCVGQNVSWSSGQIWNFPTGGFTPPQGSQGYGGSTIDYTSGANTYVVTVINSGTSGSSEPTFPAPPGTQTDNTITWKSVAIASTNSLKWYYGLCYGYAYKARPLDDSYSPTSVGGGGLTPPGVTPTQAAPFKNPPTGSETNAISTCSPPNQLVGPNSGAVVYVSGQYSPDPQCDTIVIYRSADSASGADNMYELTEIPNIPSLAGNPLTNTWTFADYLPSVATGSYPGLNVLLPAPIDGQNDPPPSTFQPMVYNFQRIWGANGEQVNFSGGPDVQTGNPNEAFNPSDELPFLAPVIRLVKTPQGIVTFLTDSIEMIGGGPATATFFSVTMAPGIGLLSYNACDVYAGEIYFFAADNQFKVITPGLNVSSFGFAIGDLLANNPTTGNPDTTWNPANVYVAVHQNGTDNCIFLADGATGWYRLNPHQIPGGSQGPEPIWSPYAVITGGCKMVQSVETSPGVRQLLAGPTGEGQILARSLTTFSDNGLSYDAYFTMGSIGLARSGELALVKFLEMDFSGQGFQPTVSYLLNEISGTFTPLTNQKGTTPIFDPPSLYGETISPQSYSPNRYYMSATGSLARCRHMQIKVDLGGGSVNLTANIEDVQISGGVLTLTVNSTTGFQVGQTMTLSGLTNAAFLNGLQFVITGVTSNTLTAATTITPGGFVQAVSQPGLYSPVSLTINNQAGNLMILFAKINSGGPVYPSITDTKGNTWNFLGSAVDNGNIPTSMFYAYNIKGGSNTITATYGTVEIFNLVALEFTGIPASYNPIDQYAVAQWAITSGPTITTVDNNTLVVGGVIIGGSASSPTPGSGWTSVYSDTNSIFETQNPVSSGTRLFPTATTHPTNSDGASGIANFVTFGSGQQPDTGTASVVESTGSTNGDEIYNLTIFGRLLVE